MKAPQIITLKAKLSIPQMVDTMLRDRLISTFAEMRQMRVVTVVAGAGYGKTTLVAQACRHLKLDTLWYRLDSSDRDILTFLHYFITGIRQYYTEFGKDTFDRICAAQGIKGEHHLILTVFLNEIEAVISKDLLVVLDDFHLVQSSPEISDALSFLAQHISPKIHLIIISRRAPDINLSRLIAAREAFEIGEKDLIFNREEVAKLYETIFKMSLSQSNLDTLCHKTEGWITGLVLFNYSLRKKTDGQIETHLNRLLGTSRLFFSYLEENIYHSLSKDVTSFLIRTSILSRLDVNFCNIFMQITNAGEILMQLEKAHLLTFPFDENRDVYYFHHLFKNFLQAKLKQELNRKQIAQLHGLAARIWEKEKEPAEAVHHYLSAQMYPQGTHWLNQIGRHLIKKGRFNHFISYYQRIPAVTREKDPWCVYLYGRALQQEGRILEAIPVFEKAGKVFQHHCIDKGVNLSLHCMASIYFIIGGFEKAEIFFKQLIGQVSETSRLAVNAVGHLIFIMSHTGRFTQADLYFEEIMHTLSDKTENDLHAWIFLNYGFRKLMVGEFSTVRDLAEKANAISRQLKIYYLITLGCNLLSLAHLHQGNFSEGLEIALEGIRTGEQKGYIANAQAWNWNYASNCAAALGNHEQAIVFGQTCLDLSRELNSTRSEAWAYHALQNAYLQAGDLSQAETAARKAVQIISRLDLQLDRGIMTCGLAAVLLEQRELEKAFDLLNSSQNDLRGYDLYQYRSRLLMVRYHHEKGRKATALKILKKALMIGRKFGHERWLAGERRWISPLLVNLYEQEELKSYLMQLFTTFGCEFLLQLNRLRKTSKGAVQRLSNTILAELKKLPPHSLHITCFGNFRLMRGNLEIPAEAWPGEKPMLLFKYLCFQQRKGYTARDELLEFLWPEESPIITSKRLHVALTKLRHTLEPELPRGTPSAYLQRRGDGYRLSLGTEGYLDIDAFDEAISAAKGETDNEAALHYYLKAEALHSGDLFSQEKYIQWFGDIRNTYKEKYLDVLEHVIATYRDTKNWSKSIEYARRYVNAAPYAEEMYQALMIYYNAIGNKTMIIKTYEQCRENIEKELDSLISDETSDLFKQLLSY